LGSILTIFAADEDKILGKGAFGIVFEGTVHKKPVAVKTLIPTAAAKDSLKSLVSELKLLSYIGYHENIVNLVGASSSDIRIGNFLFRIIHTITAVRYFVSNNI